jgi:serine/threonine-protein kinase
MELDDLKQSWQEADRKLDAGLRLNTVRLYVTTLKKAETSLRRLSWFLWLDLLVDIPLVVLLGSFIADHITEPRFVLPAVTIDLFVIALMGLGIRQLVALAGTDPGEPVVALQKRTESLRIERLRAVKLTLLASPLLWIPMLIVGLKGFLGVDAYAIFDHAWLAANVLLGLAVIPLAVWISRRYADRMGRSPFIQRVMRDLAGHNLNAAQNFLGTLARFEEGEAAAPEFG